MTIKELKTTLFTGCNIELQANETKVIIKDACNNMLLDSFNDCVVDTIYILDVDTFAIKLKTSLTKA